MAKRANLKGQRFGKLAVIDFSHTKNIGKTRRAIWECLCDCGTTTFLSTNHLRTGNTRSCGCLISEACIARSTTHGMRYTAEYKAWQHMRDRCNNPNNNEYQNYGGRGIRVCEDWNSSFEAFYEHLGDRPREATSIGRIDNDGNYQPGNVRWESSHQQSRNKRNTRLVTFNGKTQCVMDWAKDTGLCERTIRRRLNDGWSVEAALTTTPKRTVAV